MKHKNLTRNALFTSIMSLLLCVSMLVGTTFAWFTDSVVSGNNQIIAGNLDIDVMYANTPDGTYTSIENVADLFVAPNGATKGLWEPGHTEVAYLKVVNNGTLALKYQFKVDAASEVIGKSVLGDDIKLSEILKFAATDPADAAPAEYTRASAQAAAEASGSNLLGYTTSTKTLAPGASQYITLVVYMPETTGNEANYRGNAVPTINFKLTALATQVEAESDSFGDDYDEDAWDNALLVTTADDLKAAIAAGNEEIMLANDIALNEALEIPAGTTLSLNLNGKTLENEEGYAFESKGNLTISGEGTIAGKGGIRATAGTLTINGGNYYGDSDWNNGTYQHAIKAENANVVINGGNFDATVNGQTNAMLNASENATITINGGTFKNVDGELPQFAPYIATYEKNGKIVINNGTFYGGWRFNGETATTDIYGGNFTVGFDGQSFHANSTHVVTVSGGTFVAAANAKLTDKVKTNEVIAAGYKAAESSGAWTVVPENAIATSNDLIAAINAADDGDTLLLAPGEYSLRFTNNTAFNVDNLNIKGMDNAKLTVSSSEAWYGRVQGDNVTFENIHFTSSVGATGKATYKNCTFDDWAICASSGNKETYFNNCDIKGTLNTSTDFSSGNTYVTDSTVAKAEFAGAATMYFTNCKIGELISWDMATVLKNCDVEKQDLKMKDQKVTTIETDKNGLSLATNNADPDALVLYEVPSDYAKTTLAVPEGVTAIGNYAFAYNSKVETVNLPTTVTDLGRGFDSSTVKKVVLNEGLATISPRAFKSTTALEEVVISSSVKTIDDDAFQKTGLKTITIPATVEYVGAQAFGASKIETVIFKGDITIQNKAFRGCANLRTVYINGDDITFENTTGEANCWFCNSESSNPNTSEITFHVKNESVAAKVKAAMGKDIEKVVILVNDVPYEG